MTSIANREALDAVCEMCSVLREIDISECNGDYQFLVLAAVEGTGTALENLTIGEFRKILNDVSLTYRCAS